MRDGATCRGKKRERRWSRIRGVAAHLRVGSVMNGGDGSSAARVDRLLRRRSRGLFVLFNFYLFFLLLLLFWIGFSLFSLSIPVCFSHFLSWYVVSLSVSFSFFPSSLSFTPLSPPPVLLSHPLPYPLPLILSCFIYYSLSALLGSLKNCPREAKRRYHIPYIL